MVNIAFDRRDLIEDQQALDSMYRRDFYLEIAKKVGLVLLALLVFLYLRRKVSRLFQSIGAMAAAPKRTPARPLTPGAAPEAAAEEGPRVIPEQRRTRLVDEMQDAARKQPEEIARAIKTMMSDV